MPSSQPVADIEAIEDPIVKAYARAWERVTKLQQAIIDDPQQWRRANKLKEAKDAIIASMDELDVDTSVWLKGRFPQVYAMGAAAGSAEAGGPASFVWSQVSQQAVQDLAQDLFDDLLAGTKNVRDSTKTMVRAVMKDEMLSKMIVGDTAKNASKQAAKILETQGIKAITYKDGSVHGLKEYSQMAVRTKTGTAYNVGALTGAEAHGINYWEVFDGPFCGWAFHDDSIAMGRVVTKDEALSYPLAHPNCRRAFGARPDITNKKQAKDETKNGGSTSTGQRDAQIEQDAEKQESQRIARNSQARVQRRQANRLGPSKRQDKLNQRRARNGDLDMSPPSPMQLALMPEDAYAGLKSGSDLIADGWTPGDAAKEFKRLKANAASKASKQKAKLAKLDAQLSGVKATGPKVTPTNGTVLKNKPSSGSHPDVLLGHLRDLKVDTLDYVPCKNVFAGSYKFSYDAKVGIATRRDGINYFLETKPGQVIGQVQKDALEAAIKIQQHALLEAGNGVNVTKEVLILKGRNPADKYWAKQYKRPGFRSAATGGNGTVTFWDHPVNTGTLRHEAGHNFDNQFGKKQGYGSDSWHWREAMDRDMKTSGNFLPSEHWGAQIIEPPNTTGMHPLTLGSRGVTEYGSVADVEDYAESFRLYLRDRAEGKLGTIPEVKDWATKITTSAYDIRFVDAYPERAKIFDRLTGNTPVQRTDFKSAIKQTKTPKAPGELSLTVTNNQTVYGFDVMDEEGYNIGSVKEIKEFSGYSTFETRNMYGEIVSTGDAYQVDALKRLEAHLEKTTKKAVVKEHVVTQLEKKTADEFPGTDVARKGLPKNVQASIASKKSNAKKAALLRGDTLEEATSFSKVVEKDEVYKRWIASNSDGKAIKGLINEETDAAKAAAKAINDKKIAEAAAKIAETDKKIATLVAAQKANAAKITAATAAKNEKLVLEEMRKRDAAAKAAKDAEAAKTAALDKGVMSSTRIQAEVDASEAFLAKAGKADKLTQIGSISEKAKAQVMTDLAVRLDNEKDWNTFREYQAALHPVVDRKKVIADLGLKDVDTERVLAFFDSHPGLSKGMSTELAFDQRIGEMVLKATQQDMKDIQKFKQVAYMHSQGEIKAGFSKISAHASGIPDYSALATAERLQILETEVSERIMQWAVSSGDSHTQSILMQMAVKEEFGLEGNAVVRAAKAQAGAELEYPGVRDFYRRFARAQYENTQDAFKEQGITHVYLHRGMGFNGKGPAWAQPGTQEMKLQPMNSWSAHEETANDFATGAEGSLLGKASAERIFSARVPVESIIGTARSGWGCLHEAEYVVMNTPGKVKVTSSVKELETIANGGVRITNYDPNW